MTEPATPPAPIVTPPVPPAPAPAPAAPAITFPTMEEFQARVKRDARSQLKALLGTDDDEEIKKLRANADKAEETRKAELTENERLKEELATERAAKTQRDAELADQRFSGDVARACAGLGLKNLDYAEFTVSKLRKAGETLTPEQISAGLAELMKTPATAAALGLDQPITQVPAPATTGPADPAAQPPKPAGTPPPGDKQAKDMTVKEWNDHLAAIRGPTG